VISEIPRQKLCEIIARYGREVCEDPRRCEGLLRDLCGGHRPEIHVLMSALKERIATDVMNASASLPTEQLLSLLSKRLQDNLALERDSARWAVESWGLALGKLSRSELGKNQSKSVDSTPIPKSATARDPISAPHPSAPFQASSDLQGVSTEDPVSVPTPVTTPNYKLIAGVLATVLVVAAVYVLIPQRPATVSSPPAPAPVAPTIQPKWTGKWRAVLSDGFNKWTCISEQFPNGEYQLSATCPPPFNLERGKFQASDDGTWKLQAYSGRQNYGTYRMITADQVEMTGLLGKVV
jgi:hypothetical protein